MAGEWCYVNFSRSPGGGPLPHPHESRRQATFGTRLWGTSLLGEILLTPSNGHAGVRPRVAVDRKNKPELENTEPDG